MMGVVSFLERYDSFINKALPILSKSDYTFHTTQELETPGHHTIFELSWARSARLYDENPIPNLIEGTRSEVVAGYFKRMARRLRRQSRRAKSLFEAQVSHGALRALQIQEALSATNHVLREHVFKHAQLLRYNAAHRRDEYSRTYPSWEVTPWGFENYSYTKTSSSKDHFTRMAETAPPGTVARTAVHVGDRPPRFSDGCTTIAAKFLEEQGRYRDVTKADVVCNIGASFQTSLPHLEKFYTPQEIEGSYRLLRDTLADNYRHLGLTYLSTPSIKDIWRARVNPDAHPGFLARRLYATKKEAWYATGHLAENLWRELQKTTAINALPFTVGGREKRQERDFGDKITSRLVQMPEDVITRLESVVAEPLLERFKVMAMDIRVGMTYAHRDFEEHAAKFVPCLHVKTFDWSSYDSSVGRKLIISAFAIMRSQFPPGDFMDNLMMYLMSGFIRRSLVCPAGDVVEMDRGVPSGSGFTSLVGSIMNWLVLRSTAHSIDPTTSRQVRVAVQGDDSVIGWYAGPYPATERFLSRAKELWGVKAGNANPLVSTEGKYDGPTPDTSQSFLSVRIHNGLPTWGFRDFWVTEVGYRKPIRDPEKALLAFQDWAGFPCFSSELTVTINAYKEFLIREHPLGEQVRSLANAIESINSTHSLMIHFETDETGYSEVGVNHWGQKGRYFPEWSDRARKKARIFTDYAAFPGFQFSRDAYALNLFRHPLGCPLRVKGFQSRGTHLKAVRRWLSQRPARAFIPRSVMKEMGHNKRLRRILPLLHDANGGGILDTCARAPPVYIPDVISRRYPRAAQAVAERQSRRCWTIPRR